MNRFTWVVVVLVGMGTGSCIEDRSADFPIVPPPSADWSVQPFGLPIALSDVFFVNKNVGWVVGEGGTLLGTSNGGLNWSIIPIVEADEDFQSVYFVTNDFGWFAGILDSEGLISFSESGGAFPQPQLKIETTMNSIFFLDVLNGWAGGGGGKIYRTEDGGRNWVEASLSDDRTVVDMHFISPLEGWAITSGGGIFHTSDGLSWEAEEADTELDLYGIHVVDPENGWACGQSNAVLQRVVDLDGTASWVQVGVTSGIAWFDLFFLDAQNGWVVGEGGTVYRTSDAGETWNQESDPFFIDYKAIHMISPTSGWIVGDEGVILTYTPLN